MLTAWFFAACTAPRRGNAAAGAGAAQSCDMAVVMVML